MATLPAFLKRMGSPEGDAEEAQTATAAPARPERDPYQLRALPLDNVFFYCKRIDNSRLEREPDPKSRGACWSAIGAACLVVALITGVLAPSVANTLAGYRVESLRAEEQRLLDEKRTIELQEAELLRPDRLEKLAEGQNLVKPSAGQVFRLDTQPGTAVAMVK
jgi:hypothetical protein